MKLQSKSKTVIWGRYSGPDKCDYCGLSHLFFKNPKVRKNTVYSHKSIDSPAGKARSKKYNVKRLPFIEHYGRDPQGKFDKSLEIRVQGWDPLMWTFLIG